MTKQERSSLFIEMAEQAGFTQEEAEDLELNLDVMGFFTAPASTKYHGDYEGGLFDHCCAVTKMLVQLTKDNKLMWLSLKSPFVVGMFHDLCKCDKYCHPVVGNAIGGKVIEDTKKWEYKNGSPWGDGHGVKSAAIAGTLIRLTQEEAMCIIHHMGAYEKDCWQNYDAAIRRFPNVLWTHHADMLASKVHGI